MATYRGPVGVIGRYMSFFREPEDALLEDKLRVAGAHIVIERSYLSGDVLTGDEAWETTTTV